MILNASKWHVVSDSVKHACAIQASHLQMKSFIAKRVISILVNLRYLRFKLLKYKENKTIFNTFDHNFKHIPLYIMSNVSLERYYFVLYTSSKESCHLIGSTVSRGF